MATQLKISALLTLAMTISSCGRDSLSMTKQGQDGDRRIDQLMARYDRARGPGASVAVVKDGVLVHAKGYGLANVESEEKVGELTNFRLASVSKAFTAMAIMILKEQGKLNYDQKLTDVLPDFANYGRNIKIRHLLNHTSGLRDYEGLIPSGQTRQIKDEEVVALLSRQSGTYFTPGSSYRYSNSGYVTLGVIVGKVSGLRFSEFVAEHIFKPLAMTGSVAFEDGLNQVEHRAYGYTASGSGFRRTDQSVTSATLGDGGIYTSATDYPKWDAALYSEQLVSSETLKEAFTPGRLNNGSSTGYGFGWEIGSLSGHRRVSHTGSTIGFRTAVQRFPDDRLMVLVMINQADTAPWDLASQIAQLYL